MSEETQPKKMTLFGILRITTSQELVDAGKKFEQDIEHHFRPLWELLDAPVLTFDYESLVNHMGRVNAYRRKLANCFALAEAMRKHSLSSRFLIPKAKDVTVMDREAYQDGLSAPFEGLVIMLEQQLKTLDSRVNECKKLMGIEGDGMNYGNSRRAA